MRNFWATVTSKNETSCLNFFERRNEFESDFWGNLGKNHPLCECEVVSVSAHSPGPVLNGETLLSVVTHRGFVSLDGKVEPTLFESRMSNGISTDRKSHTTREEYDLRAEKLVNANPKKSNLGSIELSVASIRDIKHERERAIAVYDTALLENFSHAEIACTETPPAETPGRKKLRAKLRKKVLDSVLHDGRVQDSSSLF